jgi:hypothetical protein
MDGRLNSFQKTVLQWNDLHPYCAVHVVRVPGRVDEVRLRNGIQETLEARGLTHLSLDRAKSAYHYEGGAAVCEINGVAGGDDPHAALFAEVERQLNTPFAHTERFSPFRCFVAPAGDSFFLGLVYFHAVADAESVVVLLRELVEAYREGRAPAHSAALDLYPDNRSHLLRCHSNVLARRLLALPSQIRALSRSCRAPCRDAVDMGNRFTFFSLDPETLRAVVAAGKSWEVTVNDLWLAMLLKSLAPLAARRLQARKRRAISVGCIVNLRSVLGVASRETFGLFLGSFTVTHEVPERIGLRELARDIQLQTAAIKQQKLFLGTPVELGFARFMLKFFSAERRMKFYPKNYPLWGGITNLNLNSLWPAESADSPLDYFRGVSTGPATPLVLSVTTVRHHANIGLSYRSTVYSPEDVEGFKGRFLHELAQLKDNV